MGTSEVMGGDYFPRYNRLGISCSEMALMIQGKGGQSQVFPSVLEASLLLGDCCSRASWSWPVAAGFFLPHHPYHISFHSQQLHPFTPPSVIWHTQPTWPFDHNPVLLSGELMSSRTFIFSLSMSLITLQIIISIVQMSTFKMCPRIYKCLFRCLNLDA